MAVSPDGTTVYVTANSFGPSFAVVIDTATNTVTDTITVDSAAIGVAFGSCPPAEPAIETVVSGNGTHR